MRTESFSPRRTADRPRRALKICYLVTLYHKFDQALRLVRRLEGPDCGFVFHIDSAAHSMDAATFRAKFDGCETVAFVPSVRWKWGSYNGALAVMRCIRAAIELGPFDRYVLLSGQDYPIASRVQIREFFEKNLDVEYVEAYPIDVMDESTPGWSPYYRCRRYHVWIGNRRVVLPLIRRGPPPLPIFHGSTWWALTHGAVAYVVDQFKSNRVLRRYLRSAFLVEELYIPTLMMSSPFSKKVACADVTYTKFTPAYGPHPKILTATDFDALMASPKLFGRKVDSAVDVSILDMLDKSLGELGPSKA